MSGDNDTKPLGSNLGPIGKQALTATARAQGIMPRVHEMPEPQNKFEAEWAAFEEFARKTFESDLARAREKAMEYGSHDLEIMGTSMEALLPHSNLLDSQSRHSAGIEMAIAFYLMGKASRMFGAFKKGSTPGDDSWRDGSIYSMMARWVRQNGKWIG